MATHFSGLQSDGVPVTKAATGGKDFYVDARTAAMGGKGADGNDGLTPDTPKATLLAAYNLALTGRGDTIHLLSADDTATSVFRVAAAFTWAKDNTHLQGEAAETWYGGRARIACATTLDATTLPTLMTISGGNCRFENVHWFHGVAGAADSFALKVTGQRNVFINCQIEGIAHATAAARAGARSLTIDGGSGTFLGEHLFVNCTIGCATISQSAANAHLEFLQFASRVKFDRCTFIASSPTGTATGLFVKALAGTIQDVVIFKDCDFISIVGQSGTVARTNAMSIASDVGGLVYINPGCMRVGATDWNATDAGTVWVQSVPAAATSGEGVAVTRS